MKYSCVLEFELAEELRTLSPSRYASVVYAAGIVVGSPHVDPDFSCRDDDGRLVRIRFFGRLLLGYLVDEAAREIRIVSIEWA